MGSKVVLVAAIALLAAAPANAAIRLYHNTFQTTYRQPLGAVPAGATVALRLKISGGKPTSVQLKVSASDPASTNRTQKTYAMRRIGRTPYWKAALRTPSTPAIVSYEFRVRFRHKTLWYGDNGDADILRGGTGVTTRTEGEPFELTAYAPSFTTPAWLQGGVVYEIFADRFRNGDPSNDYCRPGSTTGCPVFYGDTPADYHPTWNEPVEDPTAPGGAWNRDFFGGDLQGIQQKLPYLKSLGVDAIWTTPIFEARSNHRYDTDNYMHVDPALGGDSAFASLQAAMKADGIHWILDGVFNHASSDSLYFDRYHRYPSAGACESLSSPWRDWFQISGRVTCTGIDYVGWGNNESLPVFKHDNQAVKDFFFKAPDGVAEHWLAAGASGWRLDAADQIGHPWWREFRSAVKAFDPDAALIAEDTGGPADATEFLLGNELDGVMNYRFRVDADGFAGSNDSSMPPLSPAQLDHALAAMREEYPLQASLVSFNLIDSHDTRRALSVFTLRDDTGLVQAKERLKLAALLQFTYIGAPMTFYGDEAAINARGPDPFMRAPYPWTDASGNPSLYGPPDQSMIDYFAKLAQIRDDLPPLRTGTSFTTLLTTNNVYAFARGGSAARPTIVALNRGANAEQATIPMGNAYPSGTLLKDYLTGSTVTVADGKVSVSVPARGGLILAQP